MHDLDRMQMEMEYEAGYSNGEYEYEDEYEGEYEDEDEYEDEYEGEYEMEFEYGYEFQLGLPLSEAEEMEFAAELLEVMDEEELEEFLGKLWKKAKSTYKKIVPKSVRNRINSKLRGLARKGLGLAGGAVGGFFGGPAGAAAGSSLASGAGRLLGLELEGLSPEDQEFEVARRFVRVAAEATKQASKAPSGAPPSVVANKSVKVAVNKHAAGQTPAMKRRGQKGIWKRRGKVITLYGV